MFPLFSAAIEQIMPIAQLRWLSFGHIEADECGAMNQWLAAAPQLQVVHGETACSISINDLAARVIQLTGSKSEVRHVPYEQAYGRAFDDLPRRVPDLAKVQKAIGFVPRLDLEQIIRSVIDHRQVGGK